MIARAALRRRWCTGSGSVCTGATTIESPVCTPSGSTFSIEQTAMHVSSASRMTSYSISCQPTRQRSTITWPMGLARRPARTRSRYSASVLDDAAAGAAEREGRPDDGRQADALEGAVGRRVPHGVVRAPDDLRRRVGLADALEQVPEALAVLGHLDGLEGRAQERHAEALQDALAGQRRGQVEGRLAAQAGQDPVRPLTLQDALHGGDRERLEVDDVGDAGVGHDRGRVRVEQDGAHALLAQGPTGLGAGVVELGRLADDDRPRADDQDALRPPGHRVRAHRHRAAARQAVAKRSKTSSASSGPGEPSGWYCTVSTGSSRWRSPSTEPSLRLRWLT